MLKVDFLPARFGDAIWIEYGRESDPKYMLVDGGTSGTRKDIQQRLTAIAGAKPHLELLVVTHIDRDHIEGVLGLLEKNEMPFTVGELWFNGWNHLPDVPRDETFGAVQGERLTARILHHQLSWNRAFRGSAVKTSERGPLSSRDFGDVRLTLLSPDKAKLAELKPKWENELRDNNLDPRFGLESNDEEMEDGIEHFTAGELPDVPALANAPFSEDNTEANGSSIAFLFEYDGYRLLFAGDAHPGLLIKSLRRLGEERPKIDLFKLPHHGSAKNVSRELVEAVDCPMWVFSSNGSIYRHPTAEAVARVIRFGGASPELVFNYTSSANKVWNNPVLQRRHGYRVIYANEDEPGVSIEF